MWRWEDVREGVRMSRCEDEQMWRWADVKMNRCERRCEDEQMWEKMWEQMWRWADVKMSRCEDEQMWRWADVREDIKDEQIWRWADVREDVKMSRCENEKVWEKVWRWEDEIQTPTIGRTLRSDALGKKTIFNSSPQKQFRCKAQVRYPWTKRWFEHMHAKRTENTRCGQKAGSWKYSLSTFSQNKRIKK